MLKLRDAPAVPRMRCLTKSLYQKRLLAEEASEKEADSPQSKQKRPGNQRWLEGWHAG